MTAGELLELLDRRDLLLIQITIGLRRIEEKKDVEMWESKVKKLTEERASILDKIRETLHYRMGVEDKCLD